MYDVRDLEKVTIKDGKYWVDCGNDYENFLENQEDIAIIREWKPEIIEVSESPESKKRTLVDWFNE